MGKALISSNKWSLSTIYKLDPIIEAIESLTENTKWIEELSHLKDYNNYKTLVTHSQNKIKSMITQIIPYYKSNNNNRQKRGAINLLGSFIKIITGNLDNSDAEKYDKQIQELLNNQNSIKSVMNKQISLSMKTIDEFEKTLTNLTSNQKLFNENLNTVINQINNISAQEFENRFHLILTTIVHQKLFLMEQITFVLTTLIDAITFAKINTFHPSIIKVDHFLTELQQIEKQLVSERLPKPAESQNILYYEKIIDVKAFVKNQTLVFIMEIPLTYPRTFSYYEIISTPIKDKNTYFYLIPASRYLLIDNDVFASPTPKCKEVASNEYLCQAAFWLPIDQNSPCEAQLVTLTTNYANCKHHYSNFTEIWNHKISDSQWIFMTPTQQRIKKTCNNKSEIDILEGSYLVYIPSGCILSYDNKSIASHSSKRFEQIKVPKLEFNKEESTKAQLPLMINELSDTSLKTKANQEFVILQDEVNRIGQNTNFNSNWTFTAHLIWIPIIIYSMWKINRKYNCIKLKKTTAQESLDVAQSWIP